MATIPEALGLALRHHRAGRMQAAELIYRQILAVEPKHAGALHLLGLIAHETGSHEAAVEFIIQPVTEYFDVYQRIDVALDPFPYGGGTTTCDALWMGVPVVSLAGQTAVGRGGLSILTNIGLPDLAARDPEQYVQVAAELAQDLPRLAGLRATLRERMRSSPLMDAPRFARNVEAAYREMWRQWCAK